MSIKLEEDIFNHMLGVHNYDSFGRAVVYALLQQARDDMKVDGDKEKNSFDIPVRVEKWGNETKCWKIQVGETWIQIPGSQ